MATQLVVPGLGSRGVAHRLQQKVIIVLISLPAPSSSLPLLLSTRCLASNFTLKLLGWVALLHPCLWLMSSPWLPPKLEARFRPPRTCPSLNTRSSLALISLPPSLSYPSSHHPPAPWPRCLWPSRTLNILRRGLNLPSVLILRPQETLSLSVLSTNRRFTPIPPSLRKYLSRPGGWMVAKALLHIHLSFSKINSSSYIYSPSQIEVKVRK